jgi:hypothetical protein
MNRNKKGSAAPKAAGAKMTKQSKNGAPAQKKKLQVSAASTYATGQSSGEARIFQNSVDSARIVHRELIGSLTGSVAFAVANSFSINPGLATTAPWLAGQAQGWEKYHFNRLRLCYYTRTGTNVPGSVILAADYDAADAAPVNEQIASAYYGTQEDAPWKDLCFAFDSRELAGDRFIRNGALAANLDVKTYDVANAFVCTTDGTAVPWGKLWLEYDVTLLNPQLPPGGYAGMGQLVAAGGSIAANTPFGAAPTAVGSYALSGAAAVLTMTGLQVGARYLVSATSGGTVISTYSLGATSGVTLNNILALSDINAAATLAAASFTVTATATIATVTLTATATTVTGTQIVVAATPTPPLF